MLHLLTAAIGTTRTSPDVRPMSAVGSRPEVMLGCQPELISLEPGTVVRPEVAAKGLSGPTSSPSRAAAAMSIASLPSRASRAVKSSRDCIVEPEQIGGPGIAFESSIQGG